MEHFFYDDRFCTDLDDLLNHLDIEEDNYQDLPEDWTLRIEHSTLESIFNEVTAESLCQLLADANEDRLTEDGHEEKQIISALQQAIDFEKLNTLLPKLYYPNNKFETITKQNIIDHFLE